MDGLSEGGWRWGSVLSVEITCRNWCWWWWMKTTQFQIAKCGTKRYFQIGATRRFNEEIKTASVYKNRCQILESLIMSNRHKQLNGHKLLRWTVSPQRKQWSQPVHSITDVLFLHLTVSLGETAQKGHWFRGTYTPHFQLLTVNTQDRTHSTNTFHMWPSHAVAQSKVGDMQLVPKPSSTHTSDYFCMYRLVATAKQLFIHFIIHWWRRLYSHHNVWINVKNVGECVPKDHESRYCYLSTNMC